MIAGIQLAHAAASPAPIRACVDAKTRALTLAASDGSCPTTQKAISWPARLDAALATRLQDSLAASAESRRRLGIQLRDLAAVLAADQKAFDGLRARFAGQKRISGKVQTLDEMSLQTLRELQMAMDQHDKFLAILSNIARALTDADAAVVANLK
jgi:hypothetical protein